MSSGPDTSSQPAGLLYPFYLDVDMSMAFAAALAGGVALEAEEIARTEDVSKAVRGLRGSLKLFGSVDLGGARERASTSGRTDESTLVRRHTAHSIFIDLHDELRSSGRLKIEPGIRDLKVGMLVSMQLRPAIAPLRRVIDQVLRLLDVMAPALGGSLGEEEPDPVSRQDRRQRERAAAKASRRGGDDDDPNSLKAIRNLFVALRDDLDHSGMIDVVVRPPEGTEGLGVVLTLDKRFADPTALELLHTSSFTVIGKVTQVWPEQSDMIMLYRRSVLSLVPALSGQVMAGVLAFLFGMAKAVGVVDLEAQVRAAIGGDEAGQTGDEEATGAVHSERPVADRGEPGADEPGEFDDLRVGDDVEALHPLLTGPAVQILPLGLCA